MAYPLDHIWFRYASCYVDALGTHKILIIKASRILEIPRALEPNFFDKNTVAGMQFVFGMIKRDTGIAAYGAQPLRGRILNCFEFDGVLDFVRKLFGRLYNRGLYRGLSGFFKSKQDVVFGLNEGLPKRQ